MNLREKKQVIKVLEEIVQGIRKYRSNGMPIPAVVNLVLEKNRFLQERGLDPEHFGWEGLDKNYWVK